jgi:hypothetical protein
MWTEFIWLRIRISGGCCEHGNEIQSSIKKGKVIPVTGSGGP